MGFQPFGYRFEVHSPSSAPAVKAAIRRRKTGIFDPKNGARGWIGGPFICLWFSAFDRNGPMLFGLISEHNLGTRVHGRAGSDLNGVVTFSLLIPLMAYLVVKMVGAGSASVRQLVVIAVVFLVGGPLMYWLAHKERREAEPLVRFLKDAVTPSEQSSRGKSAKSNFSKALTLDVGGERHPGSVTPAAIHEALLRVGVGDFVILASAPEDYIQTAGRDGGYILEMRKGGALQHFRGTRRGSVPETVGGKSEIFSFEQVLAAFTANGCGAPMPAFLKWVPMDVPN